MSNRITIQADFSKLIGKFENLKEEVHSGITGILQQHAEALSLQAKQRAPNDMGGLSASISAPVNTADLEFTVSVNAFYASFVEFGTGRYAAQYAATLPEDWRSYAATFRGKKGNGTLDQFLERMVEWVKRKGLHGLTKSGRSRTGKKADADAYNIAYVIVIRILQNGIKPHPFLYPSYEYVRPFVVKDIESLVKNLGERQQ